MILESTDRQFGAVLLASPGFRDAYKRARELQAHALVERAWEIAEDSSKDTYIDSEGHRRIDHDNINRAKLKVNYIEWFAGKIAPHIYGNRPNASAEPGEGPRSNLAPRAGADVVSLAGGPHLHPCCGSASNCSGL
jgi:hypothetical protein